MPQSPAKLLDRLDEAKRRFDVQSRKDIQNLLTRLSQLYIRDAESLIRYHELLLFLRAYPQSVFIVRLAESELSSFSLRVQRFQNDGIDTSPLEHPDVSGIAGLSVTDTFTYSIVSWLRRRFPRQVSLSWDWFEDEARLADYLPRFMPLLEEDAAVEANVPYREWLRLSRGRSSELAWLMKRFDSVHVAYDEGATSFNALKLYVEWRPAYRSTRTGMRLKTKSIFYHREQLIARRDVSLEQELNTSIILERQSLKHGAQILDLAREASTVRYRELYGFTNGDASRVLKASVGRGVELFFIGLPPDRRLPLRAYNAAMIFKNGVPVGYFEGLSLFERMESGFNLYYTFRDGETAWLYAKTLAVLHQLLGVTAFVLDPYQIGFENEEGIASGAFWFYRKLGFRSTMPELMRLTLQEEQRIASGDSYRTPPRILRRLAAAPMIYEMRGTSSGDWDRFQVRNLGFAVQRRMAKEFGGDPDRIRTESERAIASVLRLSLDELNRPQRLALSNLSLVLGLLPDIANWTEHDKQKLAAVIRAKAAPDEARYLRSLQRHKEFRKAVIELGEEPMKR